MADDIERIKAIALNNSEITIQADMEGETWSRFQKELETIDATVTPYIEIIDTKGNWARYERTNMTYLCDPKKNTECPGLFRVLGCAENGGFCRHTTNPEYRRNDDGLD